MHNYSLNADFMFGMLPSIGLKGTPVNEGIGRLAISLLILD